MIYISSIVLNKSDNFSSQNYENVVYIPFETIEIPVPIGYDTVLSAKYGDYMTPVRAGGGHDYPFFKSQIELCDSREFKLYDRYVFRRRDLERTHETDHSSLKAKLTVAWISDIQSVLSASQDMVKMHRL